MKKILGDLIMQDDFFKKNILDLTNDEIKEEIRMISGIPDLEPQGRDHIGYIVDDESAYMTDGVIDEEKLHELYNSGKYVDGYIMTLAINSLRNRKRDLFELIKKQKEDMKVLDFGCGTGTHGIACAQKKATVFFYDISAKMLHITYARIAMRRLDGAWLIRDKEKIEDNFFDTILCTDVLEHIVDPVETIRDFIKWLKVGGVAHLHISLGKSYQRGHLPDSIDKWHSECLPLIVKHFRKISDNNYELIRK
jgi:ubiquinone/menaquinone biosynthesis C-methylase UbiE